MMLAVDGLDAGYGSFEVLHGVSLTVEDQQIVALLGHNGAGKTTLLKTIHGLLPAWSGRISCDGARLGYVPQEANVFPHLSIADNLRLGAYSLGLTRPAAGAAMDEVFDLFPILRERRARPARVLSGGERQMLAISIALMAKPKLLLLDEPSAGLAPVVVQRVFDTIAEMRTRLGLTVLLVEQNVNEALRLATRAYVMQEGRIVFEGASSEREPIIQHLWGLAQHGSRG